MKEAHYLGDSTIQMLWIRGQAVDTPSEIYRLDPRYHADKHLAYDLGRDWVTYVTVGFHEHEWIGKSTRIYPSDRHGYVRLAVCTAVLPDTHDAAAAFEMMGYTIGSRQLVL